MRQFELCFGNVHTGLRLRDFFRSGAFLRALEIGLCRCQRGLETGILQFDEWLPGLDLVAFCYKYLGHAPTRAERKISVVNRRNVSLR